MKSMEQEAIEELQGYIDQMDAVTVRAAQTAVKALRDKQEREKGCRCWDDAQRQEWASTGATYCQQCGRKLVP